MLVPGEERQTTPIVIGVSRALIPGPKILLLFFGSLMTTERRKRVGTVKWFSDVAARGSV